MEMHGTAAARVGGLDLGFVPGQGGKGTKAILDGASSGEIDVVWLLGADEIEVAPLVKEADPEFERLLAEEEDIQRRIVDSHETPKFGRE